MPQLLDHRPTVTIELPDHPGSELVLFGSLLLKDIKVLGSANPENKVQVGFESLPFYIKSWNFTDEKDQPLPISATTVDILSANDLNVIMKAIQELSTEEKKD